MARKQLTTEERERIKVLLAEGLSYSAIGRALGRDHKTIAKVATEPDMAIAVLDKKKELADEYEELARRMLTSIKDDDIERISAYQRTLSAAVSTDKMRLLRGESTENVSVIAALIQQAKMYRKALEEEGSLLSGGTLDRNEPDDDPGIPPTPGDLQDS